jgi:hypothetical protein
MYHLLDGNKAYGVSFPRSCFTAYCGASHGWLVLVNELSNLVLYNPFTTSIIPLPPITDFSCVEAIYHSGGSLKGYHFEGVKESMVQMNSENGFTRRQCCLAVHPKVVTTS